MGLSAMKVLSKISIILLLLTVGTAVFAGSIWDGSVSTARYGYLPQTGMYAASNAFPKNSRVTVTNPNTGRTVDVVVLERLEDNNLFLVLSSEAAESIGINFGDIFYGNISQQDNSNSFREEELPFNPDPDVNPSADSEDYSELALIQDYIDNELGGSDDTLFVSDVDDPIETNSETVETEPFIVPEAVEIIVPEELAVEEEPVIVLEPEIIEDISNTEEDIPSAENMPMEEVYNSEPKNILPEPDIITIPEPEIVKEPDIIEEDIPVLVGMSADVPVLVAPAEIKDDLPELPVPESDIPIVTILDTGTVEDFSSEITEVKLPELPIIEAEIIEEDIPLAVTMITDIVPIEQEQVIDHILPEVISELDTEIIIPDEEIAVTDDTEMEVEIVLEPSEPRPPVLIESVENVEEPEDLSVVIDTSDLEPDQIMVFNEPENEIDTSVINYDVTRVLAEDSYYLQIGVYREQYSALDLAGSLGGIYPVTVLVSENMDILNYKVMVGPLGQDESGAVLYSFQSTGYPDAFLRKGL